MRTPAEYTKNLKSGIITEQMLSDCLYSVNKRAKNYRDGSRYGQYADKNKLEMEKFYDYKEILLSYLKPVCIHKQNIGKARIHVYDYEPDYQQTKGRNIVWRNSYINYDYEEVHFYDYEVGPNRYLYFLYYELGDRSFHTPIKNPSDYDLTIEPIDDNFTTYGADCIDLVSPQFVLKVIHTLENRNCQLQIGDETIVIEGRDETVTLTDTIRKMSPPPTERQSSFIHELCDFYDLERPNPQTKNEASRWLRATLKEHDYATDKRQAALMQRYLPIYNDSITGMTTKELAEKYGLTAATIRKAVKTVGQNA